MSISCSLRLVQCLRVRPLSRSSVVFFHVFPYRGASFLFMARRPFRDLSVAQKKLILSRDSSCSRTLIPLPVPPSGCRLYLRVGAQTIPRKRLPRMLRRGADVEGSPAAGTPHLAHAHQLHRWPLVTAARLLHLFREAQCGKPSHRCCCDCCDCCCSRSSSCCPNPNFQENRA